MKSEGKELKTQKIAVFILAIYAIGLTTHEAVIFANENETIIKVDDHTVSRSTVENRILHNFWDDSVNLMTDEVLIADEAKKLKIDNPSIAEIQEEASNLQSLSNQSLILTDPQVKAMLKERVIVKKLARKYTVTDEVLDSLDPQIVEKQVVSIDGILFEGEHEQMTAIQQELNANGVTPEKEMNTISM